MISRKELKTNAKSQLKGRWSLPIGVILLGKVLLFSLPVFAAFLEDVYKSANHIDDYMYSTMNDNAEISVFMWIAFIWLIVFAGVYLYGRSKFFINFISQKAEAKASNLFEGFQYILKCLGMFLFIGLFIILFIAIEALFFLILDIILWSLRVYYSVELVVAIQFLLGVIFSIIVILMYSQSFYILAEDSTKSIIDCMKQSRKMMKGHKGEFFVLRLSFIGWCLLASLFFYIGYLWLDPYMDITYANYYFELKKEKYGEEINENVDSF